VSVESVRTRIRAACERSGRSLDSVRLVGVSKGHEPAEIREKLLAAGVMDLAENRVQAWRDKAGELDSVTWHFIGNLQRNKVKYLAAGGVTWVHSLNSVRLAEELQRQAELHDITFQAFIEVNIANEDAKQGAIPDEVPVILDACLALPRVKVLGLMVMAPFSDDPENARGTFSQTRELAASLGLPELSMGMSGDFEVAIEEGATVVRVGSALFEPEPTG